MNFTYFRNVNFKFRYVFPDGLFTYLNKEYLSQIKLLGYSELKNPIYRLRIGVGEVKIVAWSQMHGNESTATLAMLDLLESLNHQESLKEDLYRKITLDFIFMLNPDGSKNWSRLNHSGIDLNRDFISEDSPEIKILKNYVLNGNYDYALNLHDQRTIFSTDEIHPATLSFLSPSENVERTITENRKKSMAVINDIYQDLKKEIPYHIGRYTDEFYPKSTGDNFMKLGIPCVLFEGGHFEEDYDRVKTREYYAKALYLALISMARRKGNTDGYETYFDIPENRESHYDIIYTNVKLDNDSIINIGVLYKEFYIEGNEITLVPYVVEIGDLENKKGWKEINCEGKIIKCKDSFPKIDTPVNFQIIEKDKRIMG